MASRLLDLRTVLGVLLGALRARELTPADVVRLARRRSPTRRYLRGLVLQRRDRRRRAVRQLTLAVSADPRPAWRDRLAQAVDDDPRSSALARRMLDAGPQHFHHRRAVADFVERHLDEIRAVRDATPRHWLPQPDRPVFVFWAQGFDAAPPVVRACAEQAARVVPPARLHLLDAGSLPDLLRMPPHLARLAATSPTHFSDVVRTGLLARYGGAWIDATCWPREDFVSILDRRYRGGFHALRYRGPRIANWFLAARPGHDVPRLLEAALDVYWRRHDEVTGYYMFHHLFEALTLADEGFGAAWRDVPVQRPINAQRLQAVLREPASQHDVAALLAGSFVHKLTRRTPVVPGSVLAALVDGVPAPAERRAG